MGAKRTSSYTVLSSSNNKDALKAKHWVLLCHSGLTLRAARIQGVHGSVQTLVTIQPSQQRATRAWAKSHRTGGPAALNLLKWRACGTPSWYLQCCLGSSSHSAREDSLAFSFPALQLLSLNSWLCKWWALMRHKNEKTHPTQSPAQPGGGWGREEGGLKVLWYFIQESNHRREKLQSETTGAKLEKEKSLRTRGKAQRKKRRGGKATGLPGLSRPFQIPSPAVWQLAEIPPMEQKKKNHLCSQRKMGEIYHLLGLPGVTLCPSHVAPSTPHLKHQSHGEGWQRFCTASGQAQYQLHRPRRMADKLQRTSQPPSDRLTLDPLSTTLSGTINKGQSGFSLFQSPFRD